MKKRRESRSTFQIRTTFFTPGLVFYPENVGSRFLQNTSNDVSDYIMSSQNTVVCSHCCENLKTDFRKFNIYKSPRTIQIPAQIIQAGGKNIMVNVQSYTF
jgi:hypothetical protein